jgi:Flp pilus assembly protein TadD
MARQRSTPRRLGGLLLLAGCAAGSFACAGSGHLPRDVSQIERALRAAGFAPEGLIVPYDITPEMQAWASREVKGSQPEERLEHLLAALLDPHTLGLQYEAGSTRTAAEAYAARRANCLAFTSLFVGMARAVGIEAFYLGVDDVERFERDGDLLVISGHVSAGFDLGGGKTKVLEFTNAPKADYRHTRRLADLTAIALFHSNRGAEILRGGSTERALPWLQKAVIIDPELGDAWVNLGVALRRSGDLEGAERSYRKALEVAPATASAYPNLAALLRLRGRGVEADELMAVAARQRAQDPFSLLALGDVALAHGRLDEARRYYRKALARYREDAEPYAALGWVACQEGRYDEARSWWKKAAERNPQAERVKRLEERLRRKKEGKAGGV